jgi:hypothetical protein
MSDVYFRLHVAINTVLIIIILFIIVVITIYQIAKNKSLEALINRVRIQQNIIRNEQARQALKLKSNGEDSNSR